MAYLDLQHGFTAGPATLAPERPSLSPLEWLVVALARADRVSSLREPGRIARAMGTLFGTGGNARLANDRLEALRRVAVRLWRQGRGYDGPEIPAFLAAGYSPHHFTLVADSIDAARVSEKGPRP